VSADRDRAAEFVRFCERVASDEALTACLEAITADTDFIAAVVSEGRCAGFVFDESAVRAAISAGRRRWIERWLA
jgi:hypothetical protein